MIIKSLCSEKEECECLSLPCPHFPAPLPAAPGFKYENGIWIQEEKPITIKEDGSVSINPSINPSVRLEKAQTNQELEEELKLYKDKFQELKEKSEKLSDLSYKAADEIIALKRDLSKAIIFNERDAKEITLQKSILADRDHQIEELKKDKLELLRPHFTSVDRMKDAYWSETQNKLTKEILELNDKKEQFGYLTQFYYKNAAKYNQGVNGQTQTK